MASSAAIAPNVASSDAWMNAGISTRASVLYCQPFGTPPALKCTGSSHGNDGYHTTRYSVVASKVSAVARTA